MAKQPGVMFYFDVRPCIKRLNINEKGLLFEAILDYAELGIEPNLDGALGIAWDFIQPKLDRDAARYGKQVEQKQYAVFAREARKRGQEPVPFDEWKALPDIERNRLISADTERYPTTTSTSTSTIPPISPQGEGSGQGNDSFDRFWEAYPKKQGKANARKAFAKAIKKTELSTILQALDAQKCCSQWTKDGGQYIPLPSTWLNGERWSDELEGSQVQPLPASGQGSCNSIIDYTRLRFDENDQPINLEECTV